MNDTEILILLRDILKNGDIKFYSDNDDLVSMAPYIDGSIDDEEADCIDYLKVVERDFRNDADDILEKLELSHLHSIAGKKSS